MIIENSFLVFEINDRGLARRALVTVATLTNIGQGGFAAFPSLLSPCVKA